MGEHALWECIDRSGFPRANYSTPRPFIWAHRGASALKPENTLPAFQAAADLGADGIELDIQLTRDGVPLVIHDPMLWTDGAQLHLRQHSDPSGLRPVWVRDLDWTDLEDAPVVWLDGRPERLTRFEQVIEAVPEWLWLDVELKAGWTYDLALARVFASCARRRRSGRVLASSFDQLILRDVAALDPGIPLRDPARAPGRPDRRSPDHPSRDGLDRPALPHPGRRAALDRDRRRGEHRGSDLVGELDTVLTWPVAGLFLDDPRLALPAGP